MYEPKPEHLDELQQQLLHTTLHSLQRTKDRVDFLTRCAAFGAFRKRTDLEEKAVRAAREATAVLQNLWHLLDGLDVSAVGSSHDQEDQEDEAAGEGEGAGRAVHDLR